MTDSETTFPCPFCGLDILHSAEVNIPLLRGLMISQLVLGLAHDINHGFDFMKVRRDIIERELGDKASKRLRDILSQDKEALIQWHNLLRKVWNLYRYEEYNKIVSIGELPDHLLSFLRLCAFPTPVDFNPLMQSEGRISFQLYYDAFCFAIQGALLAIRRNRNPIALIDFNVFEKKLTTNLSITNFLPEDKPWEWKVVEWIVLSTGGNVHTEKEKEKLLLRWSIDLK